MRAVQNWTVSPTGWPLGHSGSELSHSAYPGNSCNQGVQAGPGVAGEALPLHRKPIETALWYLPLTLYNPNDTAIIPWSQGVGFSPDCVPVWAYSSVCVLRRATGLSGPGFSQVCAGNNTPAYPLQLWSRTPVALSPFSHRHCGRACSDLTKEPLGDHYRSPKVKEQELF